MKPQADSYDHCDTCMTDPAYQFEHGADNTVARRGNMNSVFNIYARSLIICTKL